MKIILWKEEITAIKPLSSYEWIDTNQLGGYASSTFTHCHTRKYHGLLICHLEKPIGKYVMLSKVEDALCTDKKTVYLSAHQYRNHYQPNGAIFLAAYIQETHPIFAYKCKEFTLFKEIMLLNEENTVLIKYRLVHGDFNKVSLRPLIACRNIHTLTIANRTLETNVYPCQQGYSMLPYAELGPLYFQIDGEFDFQPKADWYKNFEYVEEINRGFAGYEDLFSPGTFTATFNKKNELIFSCSRTEQTMPLEKQWKKELRRRAKIAKKSDSFLQQNLKKDANSFICKQNETDHLTITAGYPWFGAWGRDTLISLPGLTLYSGEKAKCLAILKNIVRYEKNGLLPNIISADISHSAYNSVDASLWFGWAVQQYYYKTRDIKSVKQFFLETLKNIYLHYTQGTSNHIKVGEDQILRAGSAVENVTWMDCVVAGVPITARYGAQVENNALWYNFLCFLSELLTKVGDRNHKEIKARIKTLKKSFSDVFWNESLGYLHDYVNEEEKSTSIRPNQIFAVSLPYSPLNRQQTLSVLKVVQEHLLTPYGLRTLSPNDKKYIGHYGGDIYSRDAAYHNGSVWPWLIMPFAEALAKVSSKKNFETMMKPCLAAFNNHLFAAGIGTISEIFDGDFPHSPNGCISQAWSVAEVFRLTKFIKKERIKA